MSQIFTLDGVEYPLHVTELKRRFAVLDTDEAGRTMDGKMYRDPIGTFYNYTMTVEALPGREAELDAFWNAVSQPVASHLCSFPYGQGMLTQRMYITAGEQPLTLLRRQTHWGAVQLEFVAMEPEVRP